MELRASRRRVCSQMNLIQTGATAISTASPLATDAHSFCRDGFSERCPGKPGPFSSGHPRIHMTTRLLVAAGLAVLAVAGTTIPGVPAQHRARPRHGPPSRVHPADGVVGFRSPPSRLKHVKFAESLDQDFSVKGAPALPRVQARTAFQVMYADGSVMVDAGMTSPSTSFRTGRR